jgi:hypothetical protein
MTDFTAPPAAQPNDAPAASAAPAPQGVGTPQGFGAPTPPQAQYGGYPITTTTPGVKNGRPGLAVVAGLGAMLLSAAVYAGAIDATKHEIGYLALGVGLLVGLALGKIGGRNPVLPFVGVLLALVGIFIGEMAGIGLLANRQFGVPLGTVFGNPGDLFSAWKASTDAMSLFFFAIGGLEAFVFTRRFSGAVLQPRRRR